MENSRVETLNKKLNELVKVTFKREALLGDFGRLGLYVEGDSEDQLTLKKEIMELLTQGKPVKDDHEIDLGNYGHITIYKIINRTENSYSKQQVQRFDPPNNYKLLPYGFIMGKGLSKAVRNDILSRMV